MDTELAVRTTGVSCIPILCNREPTASAGLTRHAEAAEVEPNDRASGFPTDPSESPTRLLPKPS